MNLLFSFLSHLFQQRCRHPKRLLDQLIVSDNYRNSRVGLKIVRLRFHGQLLCIVHDGIHMLLQGIQCVGKVLTLILLFGPLVIVLARHTELLGRAWVALEQ